MTPAAEQFVVACLTRRLFPDRPLPVMPEGLDWEQVRAGARPAPTCFMPLPVMPEGLDWEQVRAGARPAPTCFMPLPVMPEGLDWEQVYALLARHKLAGLFYRLGLERPGLWPAELQHCLRRDYHSALLWGDRCREEVHTVLAALGEAGIASLVLKGWAAIPTVYGGDCGQRTYADIDLLVRPRDAARAEQAVQEQGYRASPEEWPGFVRRFCSSRPFQLPREPGAFGQVFAIALHWHLLDTPYFFGRMPADAFFARSRGVQLAGMEMSVLAPEDDLVYECGHLGLHHGYDEALFRYYELAWHLVEAGADFDWQAVLERAAAWRLVMPVQRVVARLAGLWPELVPTPILEQVAALRATVAERTIHHLVVTRKDNHSVRALLAWLTQPGLGRRLRYPVETAFPSPAYMGWRYGPAPGGLWPLAYLGRVGLAFRYLLQRLS